MNERQFLGELRARWTAARTESEQAGGGMIGVMVDTGLVAWIDDQLHANPEPRKGETMQAARDRMRETLVCWHMDEVTDRDEAGVYADRFLARLASEGLSIVDGGTMGEIAHTLDRYDTEVKPLRTAADGGEAYDKAYNVLLEGLHGQCAILCSTGSE